MKNKKILIDISVIVFAFLLFVIWHQIFLERSKPTSASLIPFYRVYLITTDKGFQYWDIINQGAADMAELVGINYIWDAPDERNTEKQIEIINNAVERGASALLIAADDPKRISTPVEDAKARGVKVIYVDTPAYEEAITTFATDNYEAGVLAARTMISTLEQKGITSGSIGIINLAEKENTELREIGFRDVLAGDERFDVIETIYTATDLPEETQAAAERMINENEELVALFGTSEGTSIGVGNANKVNNNQFVAVGFDRTDTMMRLFQDRSLDAIIDQNPYTMGYLGMAQAVAAILGKDTGPDFVDTGVSVIERQVQ